MGLFDKLKNAIDTATDAINKTIETAQKAKEPLADPIVKKYYDVTYGLLKSIGCARYDTIIKYIEYQLGESCDETKLQEALEYYQRDMSSGVQDPLYRMINENTFSGEKLRKLEEINKTLDSLGQYKCDKEEAYNMFFEREIEEITSEFEKVLNVVNEYGFKHFEEGMYAMNKKYCKNIGYNVYEGIVHMIVKKKFFEENSTTISILMACLYLATYRYIEKYGFSKTASIVLRALNFENSGRGEDGYTTITYSKCLDFVSNNAQFIEKAKQLKAKNPYDSTNHLEKFADDILQVDIMSGLDTGFSYSAGCCLPYKEECYYTDFVCNLYWKCIAKHRRNESTDPDEVYDMIWDFLEKGKWGILFKPQKN